jgi:D-alanyl-D-alanine carboxypeptidase (penicillin-binding protein 5/6)
VSGFAPRRALPALAAVMVALTGTLVASPAAGAARDAPQVPAEASIVVDADSGTVIAAEDPDDPRQIASATKLMTALIAEERTSPGEVLTAAGYEPASVESQIGLADGEEMQARDLLVALLLESANDAAITLAEGVSGSSDAFVEDMNERAAQLGLEDTSYANPIGFDDPDNHSTARDLARLGRAVMQQERLREIVGKPELPLRSGSRSRVVDNRNDLVGAVPAVDGIKTGRTLQAGHVLVGSATRGPERRVISVVLGAPSESARDEASRTLLEHGLDQFRERRVVREDRPVAQVGLAHDPDAEVELSASRDASVTALRGHEPETRIRAPAELEGPLPAGHTVGTVEVLEGGRVVESVPLVTAAAVPAASLVDRAGTTLGGPLGAVLALVVLIAIGLAVSRVRRPRARGAT